LSAVVKRSVVIAGHRTSVSLEEPFWRLLKAQAAREGVSVAAMIARIDGARSGVNLSSAIRVALLDWVMSQGDIRVDNTE
jgi:predicted DNA-binding ribbon-helix-helix protein